MSTTDKLLTSDGRLHISQNPEAVSGPGAGHWSVQLMCGNFSYTGHPPFNVEWLVSVILTASFAFRFFDGTLPPYLSSCLSVYTPSRTLRSSSDEKIYNSRARWKLKGFGRRSFSVQTPLVWNDPPPHIRHSSSLSQFKTSLKTFLFISAFSELREESGGSGRRWEREGRERERGRVGERESHVIYN